MFTASITGNVGKVEPVKDVNGKKVLNFSLAHNYKVGENRRVVWYECAIWGKLAEALTIQKGDKASVVTHQGITANAYIGKDGNAAASLKVVVDQIDITTVASNN
ncbi:single-stranded DNA-binding protein [Pseudodesulfovibrio senegalensis]|uniref:Single-stranded DNA-binding protein n=1 Tax=Pseudodesulfovibrio senegalensis TaxID=1721087 RepID=A0A6N6N1D8_9BACT|nr:single-stranded DNA-binding protein [Pseudodesulfovibrio senegalensis]KAB1437326.1 single-stranded DNA-binding protein [Pseudodesulfovibrio senegalensis]